MVLNKKSGGGGKKETIQEKEEDEDGDIDVKQFFDKTKINLKSSKIRKKINYQNDKDKASRESSESPDENAAETETNSKKTDPNNAKKLMADFMRQTLTVKNISVGGLKKGGAAKEEAKGGPRRKSVMVADKNMGVTRRSGILTGEEKTVGSTKSFGTLTTLEETDKN